MNWVSEGKETLEEILCVYGLIQHLQPVFRLPLDLSTIQTIYCVTMTPILRLQLTAPPFSYRRARALLDVSHTDSSIPRFQVGMQDGYK